MANKPDLAKLRWLAEAVQAGAGELYGLDWTATQFEDDFGAGPRVFIGGTYGAAIRVGWWRPEQVPTMTQLTEYLSLLTPATILYLVDIAERSDDKKG